jgi:Glycoside hydrolase 97.
MTIYQDGINADRNATDFKMKEIIVDNTFQYELKMAPGGGMAAMIQPL